MNMQRVAVTMVSTAAIAAAMAAPAAAQDWSWNGTIEAGRTIEVKGVNGGIRAVASAGNEVRVQATRRARRDNPEDVRMEVLEHAGGVTICAVYPHRRNREPNECVAGSGGRSNVENNDVTVEWEVQVPRGVNFTGRTINGNVEATGMTGTAIGRTINGRVRVETSGIARASTINGNIDARLGRADWNDELEFTTTNGSIVVTIPGDLNAQVNAATVTGSIETDFPLQVTGRFMNRRISGTVGTGGRVLSLRTTNGSIELRQR